MLSRSYAFRVLSFDGIRRARHRHTHAHTPKGFIPGRKRRERELFECIVGLLYCQGVGFMVAVYELLDTEYSQSYIGECMPFRRITLRVWSNTRHAALHVLIKGYCLLTTYNNKYEVKGGSIYYGCPFPALYLYK